MFGFSAFPIEEDARPKHLIVNGNGASSLSYLATLREAAEPTVDRIMQSIRNELGLLCEKSRKSDASADQKARRPTILARSPWHGIPHLRDYLRFRTHLNDPADVERVCDVFVEYIQSGDISLVKLDYAKMLRPGPFGWRMIAIDLRDTRTGLIVEHYMSFQDLIVANEDWLHAIYERWRRWDPEDMTGRDRQAMERDQRLSAHGYKGLLIDRLAMERIGDTILRHRQGLTDAALLMTLERMVS
ncbi:hypothetical protein M9979_07765 [Sphingomonas sp. RP10(2022)]|uniref:Uncharacterized protein n=1 Tax=Sphingomonas liriopis TaxID=2949094 RepID=A0A9X2HWD3_9SPHN|nr:hypothetical protein [Sphingomonas liriopis]MCP3734764.1 hypothetical protein [Sphingomonas liriopis]